MKLGHDVIMVEGVATPPKGSQVIIIINLHNEKSNVHQDGMKLDWESPIMLGVH